METNTPAWYCIRSLQKNEHIAAGNLRQLEGVEVFSPQLRVQRPTRRGPVWFHEPLFPSYVFAKFLLAAKLDEVRYTAGVNYVVNFGGRWPTVSELEMEELRRNLGGGECCDRPPEFAPGDQVEVLNGPFLGLAAVVQRYMPGAQRVRVLLEFLGRSTAVDLHPATVSSPRPLPEQLLVAGGSQGRGAGQVLVAGAAE